MKLFKYNKFIKESNESIDSICKKYQICNYTINDGLVDVNGSVYLDDIGLTKLPLKFGKVTGSFDCSFNQLNSLEGAPYEVLGYFNCYENELTSLEGLGSVGHLDCMFNKLRNFKGFPEYFSGELFISNNPIDEILKLFPYVRWKEVPEFFNEYDVIRDGNKIVLQALELVYDELGLEVPDEINIKGYEII